MEQFDWLKWQKQTYVLAVVRMWQVQVKSG